MELGLEERQQGLVWGPGVQESSSLLVELLGRRGPGVIHNERGPRVYLVSVLVFFLKSDALKGSRPALGHQRPHHSPESPTWP